MSHLRHEVKFGESLIQISWYYDVGTEDIARWNNLPELAVDHGGRPQYLYSHGQGRNYS